MKKQVEYFDDTHEYLVDGVLVPSVSKLVAFAISENFGNIPKDTLRAAADFGTRIHEIVEKYFDQDTQPMGMTDEEKEIYTKFADLSLEKNIKLISAEETVFTDDYAGRYDLLADVNGVKTLIDIKTNRNYPEEHLKVQMGLYKYAIKEDIPCACLWYDKTNFLWEYREVIPITSEECEAIVNAFKNGLESPMKRNDVISIELLTPDQKEIMISYFTQKKKAEEIEEQLRDVLLEYMRKNNAETLENDEFRISYTKAHTRKDIDKDKLKEDGLYEKYLKDTQVKDSVRITHKWLKALEQKL